MGKSIIDDRHERGGGSGADREGAAMTEPDCICGHVAASHSFDHGDIGFCAGGLERCSCRRYRPQELPCEACEGLGHSGNYLNVDDDPSKPGGFETCSACDGSGVVTP